MTVPVDNFGTIVGENPDCLLLSGTVVGENPDHVCWGDDKKVHWFLSKGQWTYGPTYYPGGKKMFEKSFKKFFFLVQKLFFKNAQCFINSKMKTESRSFASKNILETFHKCLVPTG